MAARGAAALFGVLLSMIAGASLVSAAVFSANWTVSYINAAPDCFSKTVLGINDQYPGPTVNVTQGDTVMITFINHVATEGLTMHWHGIRQINSSWADGTAQVSQCPIVYGESFTYEFVVDRPGTYFYHGHFGVQRAAGFYGALIVTKPSRTLEPFTYDDEHMIIVNDWWHRNVMDQGEGLERVPLSFVGEPQSLLLEGRGRYNCANVPTYTPTALSCNQTDSRCTPHVWTVTQGLTYRLRLASVASLSHLNFKIEGHMMKVVEADGHSVQPFDTDNLDIYSGETYSVLVKCDGPPSNYHLAVNVRSRSDSDTPTGLGILNYMNTPVFQSNGSWPKGPAWDNFAASKEQAMQYHALQNDNDTTSVPYNVTQLTVTRQLVLLSTPATLNGHIKWAINNITYVPLATPLLAALVRKIPNALPTDVPPDYPAPGYDINAPPANSEATAGSGFYNFTTGDVVEIILQNSVGQSGHSEVHPWHLHGHDFWIVGYGEGAFNSITRNGTFNYVDPPSRNNVPMFPGGWTAIHVKLDNPGAWPFHCHIEWHFHLGMGVMFAYGIENVSVPSSTLGCGLTKSLLP